MFQLCWTLYETEALDSMILSSLRLPLGIWFTFLSCLEILWFGLAVLVVKSLRLAWEGVDEHQHSRADRTAWARLRAGSCDSRTSAWDPSWIQHFSRRENFHFVFPVPTLLWGKGQIYIMKQKSGPGRGEMDLFNPGGRQTLEIWSKTQMLPWE